MGDLNYESVDLHGPITFKVNFSDGASAQSTHQLF